MGRATEFEPGAIALGPRQAGPPYRQIRERIRSAILAGQLAPGTRLPSWTSLAGQLGVARGTVKAAYDWLAGEGYVAGRGPAPGRWSIRACPCGRRTGPVRRGRLRPGPRAGLRQHPR